MNQGGLRGPYVVFLFMGGRQRIKPFIKRFGTGDEESFKDLFKNHFVEGGRSIEPYFPMSIGERKKEEL